MPIYEYKCLDCGTHLEKMQKISDALLTTCESCGGKLEKQVSRTGFQFKGEGWYVTDYAKKSSSKDGGASESKESTPKSESKSTEKTSEPKSEPAKSSKKDTSAKAA